MSKQGFVYILASKPYGVLYIGITHNLEKRLWQHKNYAPSQGKRSFTQKYNVTRLVYFEAGNSVEEAIQREKQLKKWNRAWKIELIERTNPEWLDLSLTF